MNVRQKVKIYKKEIETLKSDNDFLHRLIANTPAMQELYDRFNKAVSIAYSTIHFKEFEARRMIPVYMADVKGIIEHTKQAVAQDLLEDIKESINYELNTKCGTPTITASIFVGKRTTDVLNFESEEYFEKRLKDYIMRNKEERKNEN